MITRGFYISLLIAGCILFVGGFAFRDSEAGSQATMVVSFAIGMAVLYVLDGRERRRHEQSGD